MADDTGAKPAASKAAEKPAAAPAEPDPNEVFQLAKDAENERAAALAVGGGVAEGEEKPESEPDPMADAVDDFGVPIVGVTGDLYRPMPK